MHVLVKMDHTGDTQTCWDLAEPQTVTLAERAFADLRQMGYAAFAVEAESSDGCQITTFDETAQRIIMMPALVGG